MEQNQMARQLMEFNKTAFDNSFNAMSALQDQIEKLVMSFLDKAPWFPTEGKKAMNEWIKSYKKGCEDFKVATDESYQKVAEYFVGAENLKTKKTGKNNKI